MRLLPRLFLRRFGFVRLDRLAAACALVPAFALACPFPDGAPNVRIGHLDTPIPNLRAGPPACTLNDLIAEEGDYADEDAWLAHVERALAQAPAMFLAESERERVRQAARSYDPRRFARVKILAINDFHGALAPPEPITFGTGAGAQSVAVGGADALAATVRALAERNPRGNVLVSAGDLFGATQLVSALFKDEPTIEVMNRIGLAVNAVGNHELDDGLPEAQRLARGGCHPTARTCQGASVGTPVPFEGARFDFVSANIRERANGVFPFRPWVIRDVGGVRVGFVGVAPLDTPAMVIPSHVEGLRFEPEAGAINAQVRLLREAGAQVIVALVHEGGRPASLPARRNEIDACDDVRGPIRGIVAALDDAIDAVVSAHTHRIYNCRMPNRAGRPIPVVQAGSGGRLLAEIDVTFDRAQNAVRAVDARNVLVERARVTPEPAIAALVARYERLAAPIADAVIGRVTADISNVANPAGLSPAGALVADAQLAATRSLGAVIAFMNPGGVRGPFRFRASGNEGDGVVTYAEAFTIQPFGNTLVTLTLSGEQILRLLEEQFPGCANGQTFARVLQPSAGFRYAWRSDAPACARIDRASVRLHDAPLDPQARYRVTVNDFLAAGGDRFDVLREAVERIGGGLDLAALVRHLGASGALAPPVLDRIERR